MPEGGQGSRTLAAGVNPSGLTARLRSSTDGMDDPQTMNLNALRKKIVGGLYRVDTEAVATAILERVAVPTVNVGPSAPGDQSARIQSDRPRPLAR